MASFAKFMGKTLSALAFKKIFKGLTFSLKSDINLFSRNRGGIQGFFALFRKVFKMDQIVFELEAELADLLDNLEYYLLS